MKKIGIRMGVKSSSGDPEKLVLPSIVFVNMNHQCFEDRKYISFGFMLYIGWWHYSINVGLFKRSKNN